MLVVYKVWPAPVVVHLAQVYAFWLRYPAVVVDAGPETQWQIKSSKDLESSIFNQILGFLSYLYMSSFLCAPLVLSEATHVEFVCCLTNP